MPAELDQCLAELTRLIKLQADELTRKANDPVVKTLADRIDGALKALARLGLAVISFFAALGLIAMIADAVVSQSVVVDAFSVPKGLAERGLTQQVVAETILDALKRTQASTRMEGSGVRLTEAWSEPLKLEIPKANISIADVRDILHQFLGHDIHVGGELVQLPGGELHLVIRGDGIPAHAFSLKEEDFAAFASKAADYIYGTAEPVAFATYLLQQFRVSEGLDFVSRAFVAAPASVRPVLATLWAKFNAYDGNFARAVELDKLALELDPYHWPAWEELAQDRRLLEGPESEVATFRNMHEAALQAPLGKQPRPINFRLEYNLLHDWAGEIAALQQDRAKVASGTEATSAWFGLAMAELQRHGYSSAQHYLDEADPDDPQLDAHLHTIRSGLAPLTDQAEILREREAADASNWKSEAFRNMIPNGPCDLAISYAQANRQQEALDTLERVRAQNPKVGCEGDDGIALEYLGQSAAADKAFDSAMAAEPSLAEPYERRGEVRMRPKDWAGAASDFARAHQRAPHWADPLKNWGDALVRQGQRKAALEKYAAALVYAPEWAELKAAISELDGQKPRPVSDPEKNKSLFGSFSSEKEHKSLFMNK